MSRGNAIFKATGTTGGTPDKLDSVDGGSGGPGATALQQGDFAFQFEQSAGLFVPYELDVDSGAGENDPFVVSPDSNPSNKRWHLRFVRWLKTAVNYAGDFIVREAGKGVVLGDGAVDGSGAKIYKPAGNYPLRIVPKNDTYGVAIRNASDSEDLAVFKNGSITFNESLQIPKGTQSGRALEYDQVAWKHIISVDASGAGSVEFNDDLDLSEYRLLRLTFDLKPDNDNVDFRIRTSTDNGVTFDAGSSDYSFERMAVSESGLFETTDTAHDELTLVTAVGDSQPCNGVINFFDFNRGYASVMAHVMSRDLNSKWYNTFFNGRRSSSSACNAFQVSFENGVIEGGVVILEGIKG